MHRPGHSLHARCPPATVAVSFEIAIAKLFASFVYVFREPDGGIIL
jgi:hypothetical protein